MLETILLVSALLCSPQVPDTLNAAVFTAAKNDAIATSSPLLRVSAEAMQRSGARELHEVLRTLPGVSIKDYGGMGGVKTVSVRGLGAQHTSITVNGSPISDLQSGQIDLSRFNLENLSGVTMEIGSADEIFRPARTMTSSGVLSLETKASDFSTSNTRATAQMRFASFKTYNPYILVQQKFTPSLSAEASLNWLTSEGSYPFVIQNGNQTTNARRLGSDINTLRSEIRLRGELSNGARLMAESHFYSSERGLPGPVILYTQDPTERLWDTDITAVGSYENTRGKWKYKASSGYNYAYNRYVDTNPAYQAPEEDIYSQQEWSLSSIAQYSASENLRIVIAEDIFVGNLSSNIPECPLPTRLSSITALSGQYRTQKLTLTASTTLTMIEEYVQKGTAAPSRMRLSPAVSASYQLPAGFHIRASYKDGFRVPTFNDLYYSRVGNISLVPEKAHQTGLGLTWGGKIGDASVSLTADGYYNSVKDKIVAIPTMFIWKMRNVGRVRMLGSDLSANVVWRISDQLTGRLNANWSYLDAIDITDPTAKNYRHQIQYTPRNSANAVASLETPWLNVGYTLYAVGKRYYLPQNIPANEMTAYADHSISISKSFEIKNIPFTISIDALNIGNTHYEVVHNYPMPGRNYRITLKIY